MPEAITPHNHCRIGSARGGTDFFVQLAIARLWPKTPGSARMLAIVLMVGLGSRAAWADGCPIPTSDIDTDRPDTTNSSAVVPVGSLQFENGINVADWPGGARLDGTNSRVRLGIADCAEVLIDLPNYSFSPRSADIRGFTGIAPAGKLELEGLPQGLQVSIVTGVGLPTGASSNSGQSYKPYFQVPWSQEIAGDWSLHGMLTETWIPGQISDRIFEETLSLQRDVGEQ
ncbi:MAG TPA: transporter, partial [Rhizomicrobium sp.]|nr:transporter [Rhizomicrobium sp.]